MSDPKQLHAGTHVFLSADLDDTMAAEIERQMFDLMAGYPDGLKTPPLEDSREARARRVLFAGIARGVINHLIRHPEALRVVFDQVPSEHTPAEFRAHVQLFNEEAL